VLANLDLVHPVTDLDDLARILVAEPAVRSQTVRPSYMYRSEPQMFVAVIRTKMSVGRSLLASGTLWTLTSAHELNTKTGRPSRFEATFGSSSSTRGGMS
jgi:hypothetical protein